MVCAVAHPTQHVADNGVITRRGMLMERALVRRTCRLVVGRRCLARHRTGKCLHFVHRCFRLAVLYKCAERK